MPKELYNEGRVVGQSAYEIYVRQHLSIDPTNPPASEREWLASTIAMGESMILRIPVDTSHGKEEIWMYEAQFPSDTRLCAANTIVASFFKGEAEYTNNWATRVTSYGEMIANNATSSPEGTVHHGVKIPTEDVSRWTDSQRKQLMNYGKILDGIVLQSGQWIDSEATPPQKDLVVNLADYPRIRIQIRGKITEAFSIILTGFTIRAVLSGVVGLDGSTNTAYPEDGDFLGPAQFPWAAKVVFSMPSAYIAYFGCPNYLRQLPKGSTAEYVNAITVIDMDTCDPSTYYRYNTPEAAIPNYVETFTSTGDGTAVLATYQRSSLFPPALYGTRVYSEGENDLYPIDVAAPGTVKMFENASEELMREYQETYPGAFAMNKTDDGKIQVLDKNGSIAPVGDIEVQDLNYSNSVASDKKAKALRTEIGEDVGLSLSMSDGTTGSQYAISNPPSSTLTPSNSNIFWAMLLEALANNKSIDILGDNMKALKSGLPGNYIQFPNGLRLYISSKAPTPTPDIPVGSIGIGW